MPQFYLVMLSDPHATSNEISVYIEGFSFGDCSFDTGRIAQSLRVLLWLKIYGRILNNTM